MKHADRSVFWAKLYPSLLEFLPDSRWKFLPNSQAWPFAAGWWGPHEPGFWSRTENWPETSITPWRGIQAEQAGEKETNNMSIRKSGKGWAVRYSVLNVACFLVQKGREAHKISGLAKWGGNTKKYTSQPLHLFVFLGTACEYLWTIIKKDARLSMWNWSFIGQFQLSSSLTITICTSSWFLERFKFLEFSSPKSAIWRVVSWGASYTEVLMHLAPSSFLTASLISPW